MGSIMREPHPSRAPARRLGTYPATLFALPSGHPTDPIEAKPHRTACPAATPPQTIRTMRVASACINREDARPSNVSHEVSSAEGPSQALMTYR